MGAGPTDVNKSIFENNQWDLEVQRATLLKQKQINIKKEQLNEQYQAKQARLEEQKIADTQQFNKEIGALKQEELIENNNAYLNKIRYNAVTPVKDNPFFLNRQII